jgi:HPt (histidine-containing phosphotransfer) domain-containing protein
MRTSILRPGFLVIVNSHVAAGITYERRDLDAPADGTVRDTSVVTRWETTKVVPDPTEKKRADDARTKACAELYRLCVKSRYAYVCPVECEAELDEADKRARAIVDAHNATAVTTRIDFYTLKGLMADKSEETIAKISQEMVDLISDMSRGIDRADVKAIREAATRADEMAGMLGAEQVKAVADAVEQARKAARDITARIGKKGEDVAAVIASVQRGAIERARFAFIDTDEAPALAAGESMPQGNVQRFADLECDEAPTVASAETSATETAGEAPSGEEVAASA